jgi:hypothetical protein
VRPTASPLIARVRQARPRNYTNREVIELLRQVQQDVRELARQADAITSTQEKLALAYIKADLRLSPRLEVDHVR